MLKGRVGGSLVSQNRAFTPELAADLARYERVLFLDAEADATSPRIEPVGALSTAPPLSHASSPAEILHLARTLSSTSRGQCLHLPHPGARFFTPRGPQPRMPARRPPDMRHHRGRTFS